MTYSPSSRYTGSLERAVGGYHIHASVGTSFSTSQPLPLYTLESRVVYRSSAPIPIVTAPQHDLSAAPSNYAPSLMSLSYFMPHKQEYFAPEPFLNPNRPRVQWVGATAEIIDLVAETFAQVTGDALPHDLTITVVPADELFRLHAELGGAPAPGLQGFSLNRHGFGASTIVVKENELDKLLLTIGHEIGHVLSFALSDKHAEEAKAFAFEFAWMEAIVEHNLGNLALCINLDPSLPANNGLHDVAWRWVQRWRKNGLSGKEIFRQLARNQLSMGDAA